MFEFLKIQYNLGRVTKEQLKGLVGKRITAEEYIKIAGGGTDG